MYKLKVPYYEGITVNETELKNFFEQLPIHIIDQLPWNAYPYKPHTTFKIAYNDEAILLNYEVLEKNIRINSFQSNDPIWEDSCVEFFISFQEGFYYNLEFNALGIALVGYGSTQKSSRKYLPDTIIEKIKSFSSIETKMDEEGVRWNLSLHIPLDVFFQEKIQSFRGIRCGANFYKCGDLLPSPHFLSWSPIKSTEPNFHLPEFFGIIEFE